MALVKPVVKALIPMEAKAIFPASSGSPSHNVDLEQATRDALTAKLNAFIADHLGQWIYTRFTVLVIGGYSVGVDGWSEKE